MKRGHDNFLLSFFLSVQPGSKLKIRLDKAKVSVKYGGLISGILIIILILYLLPIYLLIMTFLFS